MKKTIITYGLIASLVSTLFMIASTVVFKLKCGEIQSMIIGYTGMLMAFIFIFVGIKNYRDKQNGGTITFWEAFKIGFFIALIASSAYTLIWLIEFHFFMPDFMEKYAAKAIEQIKSENLDALQMKEKIAEIETMRENYKNVLYRILYTLMEILPLGTALSLIAAAIMKRKNPKTA